MKLRYAAPFAALLALTAPVLAQDAPMHRMMNPEDMAKHHAQMCTTMYAHAVGKLAALEVELKLTAAQKPLFERWRAAKLASAKSHSDKCADMKMPDPDMSIMEGRKLEITVLEARLAELKAENPSLGALVASLDKDQQEILKRAGLHAMHQRMEMMGRFMDRHDHAMMHHDGDMHGDMPPPPAN